MKKSFLAICVTYAVLSFFYHVVFNGILKLLIIPMSLTAISFLAFFIRVAIKTNMKKQKAVEVKVSKEQAKYNRDIQKKEFLREYDAKIKPLYLEGKNLFSLLMRQRKVHNYEIEDLKKILNDRLGKYVDHYHNYKFKNDANEIYVKMKNFHLNEYDWEIILNFLHALEENEPIKKSNQKEVSAT